MVPAKWEHIDQAIDTVVSSSTCAIGGKLKTEASSSQPITTKAMSALTVVKSEAHVSAALLTETVVKSEDDVSLAVLSEESVDRTLPPAGRKRRKPGRPRRRRRCKRPDTTALTTVTETHASTMTTDTAASMITESETAVTLVTETLSADSDVEEDQQIVHDLLNEIVEFLDGNVTDDEDK